MNPIKRLPNRPPQPPAHNAAEWVQQRMADAQLLLWRKSCKECHALSFPNGPDALPVVAKSAITDALAAACRVRSSGASDGGLRVVPCQGADSRETSDVLIPGIQTCRQCHRAGNDAAEARCFECHAYHDWSKEKPVAGKYTVKQFAE